ncbi:MAG: hypothetical protein WC657_03370 [Candidatus Paceibacterota bacterium]|jgi:hypothetical protein
MKTNANKELLLEQLKKTPIVETACQKLGIGRSTYYFWRKEDKEFVDKADEALRDGSLLVNDLAESQLISAIKEGNMSGIMFWLRNNHATYKNRIDITAHLDKEDALTPEQEATVREALRLASLAPQNPQESPPEEEPTAVLEEINNVNQNNHEENK